MSDGQTTEAVLRLVVQGQEQLDQAVKLMRELQNESGNFSKQTERTISNTSKLATQMRTLATGMQSVNKEANDSQSWIALKNRVDGAASAYRSLNQAQLAAGKGAVAPAAFLGSPQNTTGATAADLAAFKQGSNMSLLDTAAQKTAQQSLPRLRYALYDVSTTATLTGLAVGAIGVYAIKASTDFDRAFADVRRTMDGVSDGSAAKLKSQLIDLTRTIPQTFDDVAKIATLGNQLGVPAEGLIKFTQTIAKFSTVSGISAEESAKAFGSLGTILGFTSNEYSNFASAVELVGRKSAATDADILSMTKDIGQQAHQAGLNAQQVVALSGALAQLRVAPERARGSLTTYFGTLNKAVADGDGNLQKLASMAGLSESKVLSLAQSGAKGMQHLSDVTGLSEKKISDLITSNGKQLQAFSLITGIAADKLSSMVKNGQGLEVFQAFIKGLGSQGNIVNVTKALDTLGLSQLRVSDTFERLSANQQVFNQYLGLSSNAYAQNTELNRQYAIVLDTVASKWQLFLNAIKEFAATAGATLGPVIGNVLTSLTHLFNTLTDFAKTPFGGGVVELASILAGLVSILLGSAGAAAVAGASYLAIRTALKEIGASALGASAGLDIASGSLIGTGAAAESASTGLRIFKGALVATGVGALIVALGYVIQLFTDFGSAMTEIQGPANFFIDLVHESAAAANGLIASVLNAASVVSKFISNIPGAGVFKDWAHGLTDLANAHIASANEIEASGAKAHASWNQWVDDQNKVAASNSNTAPDVQAYTGNVDALNKKLYDNLNASNKAAGGTKSVGAAASAATKEVRTLVDYANDLSGVFTRAFDIRFGSQQGIDKIASQWQDIRKTIDDAKHSIDQLRASQAQLAADKSVKEYWLSVANQYGDTVRAKSLRADISNDNSQMADNSKQIADAQAKMSTSLTGNSEAAIKNRGTILDLVKSYEDLITQYASSGLTQDQLRVKVDQLKQRFIQQATQLGFSRTEVMKYTSAFDDMRVAIGRVPRNITVRANTNPALQALNELEAKVRKVTNNGKGYSVPVTASVNTNSLAKFSRGQSLVAQISSLQSKLLPSASTDSQISRNQSIQSQIDALTSKINSGNYYTGGPTANVGTHEIAGVVHGQEFVMDAVATKFYGTSFLNNAMAAARGGGAPSFGGGSSGPIDLSDRTIDRLARGIAYFMPSLTIGAGDLGAATRMAAMADNSLRRY